MKPSAIIEVTGLSHSYGGKEILKELNLRIASGEVFALIGPTGAGKTTLLRIMDLLEAPGSGEIRFNGQAVPRSGKHRLAIRRRMSFIQQKPQVFSASVYDNVACGLRWRGVDRNTIAEKVDRMLATVGLEGYGSRNARTLSGGEAQRVALARSLVLEPEVLLLDEPTANLDPVSTAGVEELISNTARQRNTTMIIATHDMSQGQQLADRIGVLLEGSLVQTGNAGDIFRSPYNAEVARFVGMENILAGAVVVNNGGIATVRIIDDTRGSDIQAVSTYPEGADVYACVRPEDVTLTPARHPSSARNAFPARVIRVAYLGPLSRVEVNCGFRLTSLVTRISAQEMDLQAGAEVYATFKATAVHVMERRPDR
jgi:tungstate transport system ATP-binding protein